MNNPKQSAALTSNPKLARLPTPEEIALFREAYAETYPVRPLLNAVDAKDAVIYDLQGRNARQYDEIQRLRAALEQCADRRNNYGVRDLREFARRAVNASEKP